MNQTLAVMEAKLPQYFSGASDLYFKDKEINHFYSNKFKPSVSEDIKEMLRANFTYELKFYEFCKERLQTQFNMLKRLK